MPEVAALSGQEVGKFLGISGAAEAEGGCGGAGRDNRRVGGGGGAGANAGAVSGHGQRVMGSVMLAERGRIDTRRTAGSSGGIGGKRDCWGKHWPGGDGSGCRGHWRGACLLGPSGLGI